MVEDQLKLPAGWPDALVQKPPAFYQKKRKLLNTAPPKKRYRPSKKAPVSSIQAKKSAADLQK